MAYIVGLGEPSDPDSLKLETRARRWIKNVLRPETAKQVMAGRISQMQAIYGNCIPVSASTIYNCYGMTFAARRSAIVDETDVANILLDDAYHKRPWVPSDWLPGDVVIYRNDGGFIVHTGVVYKKEIDILEGKVNVFVRSTWGDSGEYIHPIAEVPLLLGKPTEVVSQRFL